MSGAPGAATPMGPRPSASLAISPAPRASAPDWSSDMPTASTTMVATTDIRRVTFSPIGHGRPRFDSPTATMSPAVSRRTSAAIGRAAAMTRSTIAIAANAPRSRFRHRADITSVTIRVAPTAKRTGR